MNKKSEESKNKITSIKNNNQEIRDDVFRFFAEKSNNGICLVYKEKIVYTNPAILKMTGYNKNELKNRSCTVLVSGAEKKRAKNLLRMVLSGKNKERKRFIEIVKKNDEKLDVECGISVIKYDDDKAVFIEFRDITEKNKIKKELKESEEKLKTATENTEEAIFTKDNNRKYTFVNSAAVKMLGLPLNKIIGKTSEEIFLKKDAEKIRKIDDLNFQGKRVDRTEEIIIGKQKRFFHTSQGPIKDDKGKIIGIAGVVKDVTEGKRTEYELSVSEKRYRKLFESAKDGILILDYKTGKIVDANPFIQKSLGYSWKDLIGKEVWEISPFKNIIANKGQFKKLQKEKYVRYENLPLETQKGKSIPVEFVSNVYNVDTYPVIQCNIRDISERQEAEQKVLKEKEKAQNYLDIAGVIIIALNKRGEVTLVNKSGCKILNCDKNEIIGKNWFDNFLVVENKKEVKSVFKKLMKGELAPVEYYENSIITKNKKQRIISWHNSIIKDEDGKIVGILSSGEDVTEKKISEKKLRRSERKYRNLINSIDVGVYRNTGGAYGNFLHFNQAMIDMFGYSAEEMREINVSDLYQNPKERKKYIKEITKNGLVKDKELFLRKKNGDEVIALVTARAIYDVNGKLKHTEGVMKNITDMKIFENSLRKSENTFRAIFEEAPILAGLISTDGRLLKANKTALEMIGRSEADVLGKYFWETPWWIHDKNIQKWLKDSIRVVAGGAAIRGEVSHVDVKKRVRIIDFSLNPIKNEKGETISIMPIGHDITESKIAEQELKRSKEDLERRVQERTKELAMANEHLKELDRLKTIFMTSMTHELRTPLNSIIGFTDIILDGSVGHLNLEQKKQLEIVKNSADYLLLLVNDIIDVGRIEIGKIDFKFEVFDFFDVAKEIKEHFIPLVEEKKLELIFDIQPNLLIESDRRRVKQIVMNFVANAVKYTEQGTIKIVSVIEDNNLRISVQDTGVGINKDDIDLLFKAFSRIQKDGLHKEGAGIGLYLSKKIAEGLNGSIQVRSHRDKGSEFILILPLKKR